MKSVFAIVSVAAFFVACLPGTKAHAFGDEPYLSGLEYEAAESSGCLKWNWQQHAWYDHCPQYVHPKAYMYPRARLRTVLRTKG